MGKVWNYLNEIFSKEGVAHLTLIDPDIMKTPPEKASKIAEISIASGSNAIMVGGSTAFGILDETIQKIKSKVDVPVILFPGNVSGLSKYADAVFFMSLLNSRNVYWVSGAQALSAPFIKQWNLEPIPMAYLILEPGATVSFVGDVNLLPRNKPGVVLSYALAAQYLGFKLVYLEAGSGAEKAVPIEVVKTVSQNIDIPVVVGGGINTPEHAKDAVKAGAKLIVQGTFIEKTVLNDGGKSLKKIISAIKET